MRGHDQRAHAVLERACAEAREERVRARQR